MYKISDNKALYFRDINLTDYPANSQRIIRSSVDYFCRWVDANAKTENVLVSDYLDSLLDLYHSHLFTLTISKSNIVTKLKYAKLFVLWLQSTVFSQVKKPIPPLSGTGMNSNDTFRTIKHLYYLVVLLIFCAFLYLFYLIVNRSLSSQSTPDRLYTINSTRSIRIQLSPTSFILSSNSLKKATFEFKFVKGVQISKTFVVYCPVSYLGMELNINIITIPLSSCFSKNIDASTELIDFNGYVEVYIDGQFASRMLLS